MFVHVQVCILHPLRRTRQHFLLQAGTSKSLQLAYLVFVPAMELNKGASVQDIWEATWLLVQERTVHLTEILGSAAVSLYPRTLVTVVVVAFALGFLLMLCKRKERATIAAGPSPPRTTQTTEKGGYLQEVADMMRAQLDAHSRQVGDHFLMKGPHGPVHLPEYLEAHLKAQVTTLQTLVEPIVKNAAHMAQEVKEMKAAVDLVVKTAAKASQDVTDMKATVAGQHRDVVKYLDAAETKLEHMHKEQNDILKYVDRAASEMVEVRKELAAAQAISSTRSQQQTDKILEEVKGWGGTSSKKAGDTQVLQRSQGAALEDMNQRLQDVKDTLYHMQHVPQMLQPIMDMITEMQPEIVSLKTRMTTVDACLDDHGEVITATKQAVLELLERVPRLPYRQAPSGGANAMPDAPPPVHFSQAMMPNMPPVRPINLTNAIPPNQGGGTQIHLVASQNEVVRALLGGQQQ